VRPIFTGIFKALQRGGALEAFVFYEGYYLLALDGTEYFCSDSIHCPCCLCRESSTGKKSYYHQMLAAALVKPGKKEVIALAPEPIVKQDGDNKNDCERNAGKRFLRKFRAEHPRLPIIIVEDGLSSNAPHIRLLKELDMRFLLIVKEDDHEHLFEEVLRAHNENRATCMSDEHPTEPGVSFGNVFVRTFTISFSSRCGNSSKRCCTTASRRCRCRRGIPVTGCAPVIRPRVSRDHGAPLKQSQAVALVGDWGSHSAQSSSLPAQEPGCAGKNWPPAAAEDIPYLSRREALPFLATLEVLI
jgi:hypothetical protein